MLLPTRPGFMFCILPDFSHRPLHLDDDFYFFSNGSLAHWRRRARFFSKINSADLPVIGAFLNFSQLIHQTLFFNNYGKYNPVKGLLFTKNIERQESALSVDSTWGSRNHCSNPARYRSYNNIPITSSLSNIDIFSNSLIK